MTLTRIKITTIQLWALLVGTKSPLLLLLNVEHILFSQGKTKKSTIFSRKRGEGSSVDPCDILAMLSTNYYESLGIEARPPRGVIKLWTLLI